MNRLGFTVAILAVVASAAWAYHINYRTKTALGRVEKLRGQIAAEREAAEVLRVEWAYLNAPERLARLVELNNDRLGLEPIAPRQFDDVSAIPFPPRAENPSAGPDSEPESGGAAAVSGPDAAPVISQPILRNRGEVPLPTPRPAAWRLR
jgi:hypothetical protein